MIINNTYAVGGCIRDILLNRSINDIDWVIVGVTPEWMFNAGFTKVGADFQVFIHPETGDEWALARTERKTGIGYNGFDTVFDSSVTLEDDLSRRDLRINSMAVSIENWDEFKKTKNPNLVIDPFNGMEDLKNGILRHISDAFAEDPVRVLRVARFAARYNFTIADETLALMKKLTDSGELTSLTSERIFTEFKKTLSEKSPLVFFKVLDTIGANTILFPGLIHMSEKQTLITNTLERANLLSGDFLDKVIILTINADIDIAYKLFKQLKSPIIVIKVVNMSCTLINDIFDHSFEINKPEDFIKLLDKINAWKFPDVFLKIMKVFVYFDDNIIPIVAFNLLKAFKAGNVACFDMLTVKQKETLKGVEIGEAIKTLRLQLVKKCFNK